MLTAGRSHGAGPAFRLQEDALMCPRTIMDTVRLIRSRGDAAFQRSRTPTERPDAMAAER